MCNSNVKCQRFNKKIYKNKNYKNIERDNLKLIQTPQGFKFKTILHAHQNANKSNYTDDSLLAFENGNNIKLI